jgi:hypothetical protein
MGTMNAQGPTPHPPPRTPPQPPPDPDAPPPMTDPPPPIPVPSPERAALAGFGILRRRKTA